VQKRSISLFISAFSLGYAFITRPTAILVLPALFVLLFFDRPAPSSFKEKAGSATRNIALFMIAFLPFILLTLWYNNYRFGSFFESGYGLIAARTGIDFFSGTPLLVGLKGFLVSPGKGFFYYSPIAVLSFFVAKSFYRRHPGPAVCFVCIMASYLLFLSKNIYWHGDIAWGPRYILAITPFFIIPLAELFGSPTWTQKQLMRKVTYAVLALSVIIQLAAVSISPDRYFLHLHNEQKIKFTAVAGEGAPSIVEPPPDIYFDWGKSPIVAQFRFVWDASQLAFARNKSALIDEKLKLSPKAYSFDYWWYCNYVQKGTYDSIGIAILLVIIVIYTSFILYKAMSDNRKHMTEW
jgi:hypothetical protein